MTYVLAWIVAAVSLGLVAAPNSSLAEQQAVIVARGVAAEEYAYEEVVTSATTGRGYRIRVWAPLTAAARTGREVPLLLVLDGRTDAGLAASLARQREARQLSPGRWIATVSPVVDVPLQSTLNSASWDGGDYRGFSRFITEELLPLLKERHGFAYATLLGEGDAGHAALEILVDRPEAFAIFLVRDPRVTAEQVQAIAQAVPPLVQEGYAPKLVLDWTSAPHLVDMPLMVLPQALVRGGRRAEWHINLTRTEFLERALGL